MKQELAERLENRNVLEILKSLERDIQRRVPDGKIVHQIDNLRHTLGIEKFLASRRLKEDSTFREYREQYTNDYERAINLVYEINCLGIPI